MKPKHIKPEHLNLDKSEREIPDDIKNKIQAELFEIPL